jgi:Bacterial Ig-like domain
MFRFPVIRTSASALLAAALLAGCGGGAEAEKRETLTINFPSRSGSYRTDQAYVTLQGTSFKPAYVAGPTPVWLQCTLTRAYGVSLVDNVGGVAGAPVAGEAIWTGGGLDCQGLDAFWRFIDLPVAPGENRITVTAREGHRWGSADVVIERIADVTPPTVPGVYPSDGATGVDRATAVSAEFSEPMDEASLDATTMRVVPTAGGAAVPGTVSWWLPARRAEFHVGAALQPATSYTVEIAGARDASGVALAAPVRWSFTTAP